MLAAVGVFAGEGRRKKNVLLNYDGHITGPPSSTSRRVERIRLRG
jgi:hypothetical protein